MGGLSIGVFLHSMKEISFLRNSVSSFVFFWLRIDSRSFLMPFLDCKGEKEIKNLEMIKLLKNLLL